MELLMTCLILFGIALLIPVFSKLYKETMWRYIKEKLEYDISIRYGNKKDRMGFI